jgi:hypothetical protein
LFTAAQKARDAAGFQVVTDPKSGERIGAPTNAVAGARLNFASSADADLGALYARLSTRTPTRKITYKAIKPDAFFVVSGQDGAAKFYTRFDKNAAASPPIRGFTFVYPASGAANLDRVALAVANSFEPFPMPAAAPSAKAAPSAAAPPDSGSGPSAVVPQPAATALVVAPGKALTALKADAARIRWSPASPCVSSAPTPQPVWLCLQAISPRRAKRPVSARRCRILSSLGSPIRASRQARPRLPAARRTRS